MNDLVLALKLTTSGGQLVVKDLSTVAQASRNAGNAVDGLGNAGQQASSGLGKASQESQQLGQEAKRTTAELDGMRGRMMALAGVSVALFGALQAFSGVRALIDRADDFNVLQQRIRTATAETNDFNIVSAEMYAIAQRNGAALGSTVELFQRLATSRKDLKATNDQMLAFTDGVQKLGVIGGSSTQALDAGLMQLSQGLSGGVLRAEEFNSLLENIPELASRIGKGMDDIGKTENELGLGDLRKLVLEGKLLSEDVLQSILVQLPEIEKQFANMPISVGRAGTMLDNSFSAALSRLDTITGTTQAWADILASISKTLDEMSASELQDTAAALVAVAGGAAALVILSRYNIGLKSIAVSGASVIATTVSQTAALLGVAGASAVATRQITALGVASAVASRAMALLTGPVGLALLAAGAIYQFSSNSELGAEKADELAERLRDLSGAYGDLGKAKIQDAVASNTEALQAGAERIAVISQKMAEIRKVIDANPAGNAARAGYKERGQLKQELAELTAQQKVLLEDSAKLGQMFFDFSAATDPFAESVAKTSDELLKLYNAQMLNAQAVDSYGRALNGIDLELFKTRFKEVEKLPKEAEAAIKQFFKTAEASAQLAANDKYLNGLKEEVRLQQIRLNQGEAEYELAKAISSQKMADPAQLKLLKDTLTLQRQIAQTKTQGDALKALKAENDLLEIRLTKGEKEYQLQKMIRDLKVADPAVIKQLDDEIARQALLNEQLDVRKYLTDGSYDEVLDGLTKIGDAGSSVGNALVDSFGSVADQFARMAEQQDEFTKKFLTLSEARNKAEKETDPAKRTKALEKAEATERQLMQDQTRLQMGNYASLAGAAGKMFSEQSKGRQVMHKLEVTFAAIETALALKKAAANAIAAITNQGSGDPYTAFARIAAMAAIMAGLGVFNGSASGSGVSAEDRQKSQGTGTVLGDSEAKSESIANSLSRIEDLELDQYAELRSINGSIRELSAGIKNLAVNLVASYGRFNESNYPGELGKEYNLQLGSGAGTALAAVGGGLIGLVADKLLGGLVGSLTNKILGGLFGSTKKELIDSGLSFGAQQLGDIIATGLVNATVYDTILTTKKKLFGLSKSSKESTEQRALDESVRAEFGRIFSHMGKSVTEAVKLLGLETSKTLESFVINLPSLSFKDLSGDEIEKELQAIFSQQGDLMVQFLVPGIAEFQKMGEGLYDTLIRVAQEQAVFNAALDGLGLQLSRFAGVTKTVEMEVAQSLIELMGGIEKFSAATSTYFAEFYSEAEQQAALTAQLNAQFASLGISMPATREQFKSLIGSLDLTTEAGQKMFASLMGIIDGLDQFYDAAEAAKKAAEQAAEQAKKEAEAKAEAARQLAADRTKYEGDLNNQLSRLDMSALELALDDVRKWYAAQIEEAKALGASTALLEQLYARKREQIIKTELERINQDTERQMQALTAEHDRAVSELTSQYDQLFASIKTVSEGIANAILEIQRGMNGWDESAYQRGNISALRGQLGSGDIATQVKTIEQLQAAIVARYQADMASNTAAMDAASARLEQLTANWQELQSALTDVRAGITAAILDIQRSMAGWDEAGYQSGQVGQLRNQIGAGSVLEQINTIEQLQAAIVGRYQAERTANEQLQAAADSRYQAELAAHKAVADAAKQLLSAADALRLSDFSPALMGDQFNEAKAQFQSLLGRAQGGDAEAMRQLQSAGNSYLGLARDYYASGSSEYASIFKQVEQAYRSFSGLAGSDEPVVPRAVLDYQSASNALQQSTIAELQDLQTLLDTLQTKATAEQSAAEATAKAEISAYQAEQRALQQSAIAELSAVQTLLDSLAVQAESARQDAMATLVATLESQKAALLDAAERQIAAIKALQPVSTAPVITNPEPINPVMPPVVLPPQLPPKDDRIWLPPDTGQTLMATTEVVGLLTAQLKEQQKANMQQQRQMAALQDDLQRTQAMLFESRRQA